MLVILSVLAGSVTFAGSVAAVDSVAIEEPISPNRVDAQATTQHSFNYSFSGVNTTGETTLSLSVPGEFEIDSATVEMQNASGDVIDTASVSGDAVEVTATPNTTQVFLAGDVTLTAPDPASDTEYRLKINSTDNDGTSANTTDTLTVDADIGISSEAGLNPTAVDESTETQHTFNYSVRGLNTSRDTTFSLSVPNNVTVETEDVAVKDAGGAVVNDSADQSATSVTLVASPSTSTAYLAGSVNLTSPAVPDDREQASFDVTVDADDGEDSASLAETVQVNFSGGAPGDPTFEDAVQYVESDGTPTVEVAFSEDVQNFESNYELYVEGEGRLTSGNETTDVREARGRAVVELDRTYSQEMTITLEDGITDPEGNALSNPGNETVTFARTSVTAGERISAYKGANVAVVATASGTDVTMEGTDDDTDTYFFQGSTGVNSRVFLFATTDRALGDYEADIAGEGVAEITVRDLDLSVSIDDRNVTNLGAIEGTVEARASNREVRLELLDDEEVVDNTERFADLSGQGEYEFSYDLESLDIDTGEYTVRVTDTTSGISVESEAITVTEAGDTEATFPDRVLEENRGDVVAIPIELSNTREATLIVGDEDVGFRASVTVRDSDDADERDDRVTVYFDSYAASTYGTGSFEGDNEVFSVSDDDELVDGEVSIGVSDLLDAESYPVSAEAEGRETDVATMVLQPRETTAIRTWTAPRNRYGDLDTAADVREATGDWVTRDSDIATGDTVVYEVSASGLEGALDAFEEDTVTSEFFDFAGGTGGSPPARFTVEQRDPGPNRDPLVLELNDTNSRVVADSDNDTYYVISRTGEDGPTGVRDTDEDGAIDAGEDETGSLAVDEDLRASFTVFGDDENDLDLTESGDDERVETTFSLTEAELSMNEPFNVTETSGQEVFGEATVAPGTELNIRVRSDDNVRPAFLKTATTTVDADGQFLVTLSFNDTNPGDAYTIEVDDSGPAPELTVEGTVQAVIPTATTQTPAETTTTTTTSTPTTTTTAAPTTAAPTTTLTEIPTIRTSTTTPGFGVLAALVALAAAALLVYRRG
ncbi:PGF-CTERM sorting domain-containing protein [Halobellus sp. Atlit-31R]|nr:PGF-CTERM sorting domain-containing protein [Halobellus sp. Atlit-31R]